jgi:hypothetical protein
VFAVTLLVVRRTMTVKAIRSDIETTHIKDADVENSSLIIGTYIIYLNSLTDEIYDLAKESQSNTNQTDIYYKSELADGSWFEISSATMIGDITKSGTPVDVSVIENLEVRYHTKSDGITYDLLSNEAVCVFDINDPYDMAKNTDLESVAVQKQLLEEKDTKSDSDEFYNELLGDFMDLDVKDSTTEKYDRLIGILNSYYGSVASDATKAEILNDTMGRLDSTRRAKVYDQLYEELADMLDKAGNPQKDGKTIEQNSDVMDAITTAMDNVEDKLTGYQSEQLEDTGDGSDSGSESVLANARKSVVNDLVNAVEGGDGAAIDKAFARAEALNNIENGVNGNSQEEIDYTKELLEESLNNAKKLIAAGVNDEYKTAQGNGMSQAGLSQLLKEQKNEISQALDEALYYVKSAAYKMTTEDAKDFLEGEIERVEQLEALAKDDDLKPYIQSVLDAYEKSVNSKLLDFEAGGSNEIDKLLSRRQELLQQRRTALDTNDLETAKSCLEQIEDVDNRISVKETELNAIISSSTSTDKEKSDALAQLESTSAASSISEIKDYALEQLADGDYSAAQDAVSGISALVAISPETAKAALKEIYSELVSEQLLSDTLSSEEKSELTAAIEDIQTTLVDNADLFMGNDLNRSQISQLVEQYFGGEFSDLRSNPQAQAAIVQRLEETGEYLNSSVLLQQAYDYAALMYSQGNPYVYQKLKNETAEYVSLENLSECMGYRYIFSDSTKQAILRSNDAYYSFSIFSREVQGENGATKDMGASAMFQNGLYIPADYVSETFQYECITLIKGDYQLIYTDEIYKLADDFDNALLSAD